MGGYGGGLFGGGGVPRGGYGYGQGGYSYGQGGGGGGGGMVGLDQLLKLLTPQHLLNMQGGYGGGGMNAPNAAGAIQGGAPGGFNLGRGVGAPGGFNLSRGNQSLAPSVPGAPEVTQPGDQSGVSMGNLLALQKPGGQAGQGYGGGLGRARNPWGNAPIPAYGGGLARRPGRAAPQAQQQGPRVFSMTAQ